MATFVKTKKKQKNKTKKTKTKKQFHKPFFNQYKYPFTTLHFPTLSLLTIFSTTTLIAKKNVSRQQQRSQLAYEPPRWVGEPIRGFIIKSESKLGEPKLFGMSSQELFQQHQALKFWQETQQQNTLNSNFQNLQFTQQSQQSQTETNKVPETPTSPPKKTKGRVKRKSKKNKEPAPIDDDDENEEGNKAERWQASEENLLATCWVAANEDEQVGHSQAKDTFWQRVLHEFNKPIIVNAAKI